MFKGFNGFPIKCKAEFCCKTPNNQREMREAQNAELERFFIARFGSDPCWKEYFVSQERLGCAPITNNSKSQ